MSERLLTAFPGLRTTRFNITSPIDATYNCIAWAVGNVDQWWWPFDNGRKVHWPDQAPRERTLAAFTAAFNLLGYTVCDSEALEAD